VKSIILRVTARILLPLMSLFSLFVLLRGHNDPGGGFIGGLIVGAAFSLYLLACGLQAARQALLVDPRAFIVFGLALAAAAGIFSLFAGAPFLTGFWAAGLLPVFGKLGTPTVFDIGVYFVVIGVSLTIVFALAEE